MRVNRMIFWLIADLIALNLVADKVDVCGVL